MMPVVVRKRGSRYVIVEKATGKVKGHSDSKRDAEASARIRNAAKRKPATRSTRRR
jgi:hypothetical protein